MDFALRAYDYRESTRNLALLEDRIIPKARRSWDLARAGYVSGRKDFFELLNAERTWLNFQLDAAQERTRRELALAGLSLTLAGVPPPGAPMLAAAPDASTASHPP